MVVKYRQWLQASFVAFAASRGVTTVQGVTATLFEEFRGERNKTQSAKSMYTG